MKLKLIVAVAALCIIPGLAVAGNGTNVTVGVGATATSNGGDSLVLPGSASVGGASGVDTDVFWIFGRSRPNTCDQVMNQIAFSATHGRPYHPDIVRNAMNRFCPLKVVPAQPAPRVASDEIFLAGNLEKPEVARTASVVQSTVIQPQPATTTVTIPAGPIKVLASDGAVRYVRSKDAKLALLEGKTVRIGTAKATMADIIN